SPVLDLLGVKYLAAPPGVTSPVGQDVEARDAAPFHLPGTPVRTGDREWPRVYDGPDMTLFERPRPFPRFRLVNEALPGGIAEPAAASRATLADSVFISPETAAHRDSRSAPAPGPPGDVRVVALGPERFSIETDAARDAILATSQKAFAPYWR